jgi:hypothetical protein
MWPLRRGQSVVAFEAGGPVTSITGIQIPIPYPIARFRYGLTDRLNVSAAGHMQQGTLAGAVIGGLAATPVGLTVAWVGTLVEPTAARFNQKLTDIRCRGIDTAGRRGPRLQPDPRQTCRNQGLAHGCARTAGQNRDETERLKLPDTRLPPGQYPILALPATL